MYKGHGKGCGVGEGVGRGEGGISRIKLQIRIQGSTS